MPHQKSLAYNLYAPKIWEKVTCDINFTLIKRSEKINLSIVISTECQKLLLTNKGSILSTEVL